MKNMTTCLSWAAALLGLCLLSGCAIVPETGRSQLNLISPGEEMKLGLTSFESIKKEQPVSKDAASAALVQKVGQRVAAVAQLPGAQWEFVLFDSAEANAFCLPGGKVGIYAGILPITKDEAGLATVIAHEVAHAVARHGAERMSEALLLQTGGQLLGSGLKNSDPRTQALVLAAYGIGSKLGRELPHSRAQELEADRIGLLYMARAGYNPEAALDFWKRFAAAHGGSQTPAFLRTHPLDAQRIEQIRTLLPEARTQYRPQ